MAMIISCIFRKLDEEEEDESDENAEINTLPAFDEELVDDPIMSMGKPLIISRLQHIAQF